jgi:tetratricopeptide (TPR) repeat protein
MFLGKYSSAIILLLILCGARAQVLKTPQEYNHRGLNRQSAGDLAGAIDDFSKAIDLSAGILKSISYGNRANARMSTGDWDGAIADFTQSIDIQLNSKQAGVSAGAIVAPPIALSYNNRGNARKAKGDIEGAITDYNKALAENPKYAHAFYNRGVAFQTKSDCATAIKDYSTAIALAPQLFDAYVNRGQCKQSQNDLDGAIGDYNAAIQLKSDDSSIYFARGTARQAKEQFEGALSDFSRTIELDPNAAEAYAARAVIKTLLGNTREAESDFARAFTIDPALKTRFKEFIEKRHLKPGLDDLLESVSSKKELYAANADAKLEIAEAIKQATNENRRILLVFGGNWCYDCHVLDQALHQGEAGKIVSDKYLLVHVDIGEGEKNAELVKEYKIPLDKGVPAVAVLDADGKLLYSSGEGEFEAARRMLKKDLLKFLTRWKPL